MDGQAPVLNPSLLSQAPAPELRAFACARCSRRKQRCDRRLPRCAHCEKAGCTCEAADRELTVVHAENNTIQKKGYVKGLEETILSLEKQLQETGQSLPPYPTVQSSESAQEPTIQLHSSEAHSGVQPNAVSVAQSPSAEQQSIETTNVNMQLLSLSAMAEPRSRAGEFLRELSMPRIISAVTETYGGNPESTARVDILWDGIAKYIRQTGDGSVRHLILPQAEATKSLQTYLDVVDFRYPRIPPEKVQCGIDAITDEHAGLYQSTLSKDPAHIFFAYMVIAITPLVSDMYPVSQGSFISTHILAQSLKVLEKVFQKEDGVDIIHCLHLLVIFSMHSATAGSSWHLIGIAMKKCIALGYHRDPPKGVGNAEAEARRWAFWSCYLLDRLISSALGRPTSLNDRYVTASLPGQTHSKESENLREAMHVHLFRYVGLMSTIVEDRGQTSFDYQVGRVFHWRESTPSQGASLERQHSYQTSLYNTLLLRIAIDQIRNSQQSHPRLGEAGVGEALFSPLEDPRPVLEKKIIEILEFRLVQTCRAVVASLGRRDMRTRSFLSWITGYSAFTVALAILYYVSVLTSLGRFGLQHAMRDADNVILDANQMLNEIMQTLGVVARQFPRMDDFRRIVAGLRWTIDGFLLDDSVELNRKDPLGSYKLLIDDIRPAHLKSLAESLLMVSQLDARAMVQT